MYTIENDSKQVLAIARDLIDNSATLMQTLIDEGAVDAEERENRYDAGVSLTSESSEELFNELLTLLESEYGKPEFDFEEDLKNGYIDGPERAWMIGSDKMLRLRKCEDAIMLAVRDYNMAFFPKHKLYDTKDALQKVSQAVLNKETDDNLVFDSYATEVYERNFGNGAFVPLGGRYCFEYDNIIEMGSIMSYERRFITGYYTKIQSLLIELYGEPSKKDEGYGFSSSSLSVWEIEGKNLCLLHFSEYGDGDFEYKLLLFCTNFETRYLVEDDDDEDEDWDDEDDNDDEPDRPATVPADAVWNDSENEWETGAKNAMGAPVGEWKWWLAPKGYLCCHTFYRGDRGDTFSFTRFHEDGTPSRIGDYVNNQAVGEVIWIRSDKPTIEEYPSNAGKNVWKTVSTIRSGYTVEEHYYDKEGNEVQEAYISKSEISELDKHLGVLERFVIDKCWDDAVKETDAVLEKNLIEANKDLIPVLHSRALALYMLNNKAISDSVDTAATTILDAYTFEVWPFLSDFNKVRNGLRFAYYIKARQAMDSQDYDKAEEMVNDLFGITSPIDTDDMSVYKKLKKELLEHL